jgi:hypothetical protein
MRWPGRRPSPPADARDNVAILRNSKQSVILPCRCLVGRSSLSDIVLESRRSSNEHASIGWYSNHWYVRDLGSSNGTSVDGRLLAPRERVVLSAGSTVQFGGEGDEWHVADTAAPAPCAVLLGPQRTVWGQGSVLVLPDEVAPEASVYFGDGGWHVDDGGGQPTTPDCGDIVNLPSGYWRLLLPDDPDAAAFTMGYQLDLEKLELRFDVSQENLLVHVVQGPNQVRLPARACLQTLWLLAKLRQGTDRPSEGWIATSELAALRACSPEKINVDVHRLRKLFEEAGIHGAANIVERDDTKRLRIGVQRLHTELA